MSRHRFPFPDHVEQAALDEVWRVPYQQRAEQAQKYAGRCGVTPASQDEERVELVLIDVQNTFCLPDFELFVAGRSGRGAVEDNERLMRFIYRYLGHISGITATMDTHHPLQVFHALFLVDEDGTHPPPNTIITDQEVREGRWKVNPEAAASLGMDPDQADEYLRYYTSQLAERDKFDLLVWPYHAMLGGIGHALVSGIEEAVFFHSIARQAQPDIHLKGDHPLTEAYSAVGPEVSRGPRGEILAPRSRFLLEKVEQSRAVIIAGQAQSHCVAWTVSDLLEQIRERDPALAERVYLLEDCTSPVVIPGAVDFTQSAEEAFDRFQQAGMHRVTTEDFPLF